MDTLRRGDTNSHVKLLQRVLNKANRRDHLGFMPLMDDGIFGRRTEEALRAFQSHRHISRASGECDPGTWAMLGVTIEVRHRLEIIAQPTTTSCWAAAAAMILGTHMPSIGDEHLSPGGGLLGEVEDHRAFGESLGWSMPPFTPGLAEFINLMQHTPLWARCGGADWAHAVVFAALESDGTPEGTLIQVLDPWPPGTGRSYGTFADHLISFTESGHEEPMSLEYLLVPG